MDRTGCGGGGGADSGAVCHHRHVSQFLLVLAVALTVGAIVFGIIVLISGDDDGLSPAEPDGRAIPLPADRPLVEPDLSGTTFDIALRGYRMAQVDRALRRVAYDIGYKDELIKVLQAEVDALREGRFPDAEVLRRAREAALAPVAPPEPTPDAPDRPEPPAPRAPEGEAATADEPAEEPDEPAEEPDEPAVESDEPAAGPPQGAGREDARQPDAGADEAEPANIPSSPR
jgi:DivIVA domain-containing protein